MIVKVIQKPLERFSEIWRISKKQEERKKKKKKNRNSMHICFVVHRTKYLCYSF